VWPNQIILFEAFNTWCLRKTSRIPYTRHTTNKIQCKASPPVHQCLTGSSHSEFLWTPCSYHSRGGPLPCHCRCTCSTCWVEEACRPPENYLVEDNRWWPSPWTSGSTRLGGRQEIRTFGIKSSVRQRFTEEFANKEEEVEEDTLKACCFTASTTAEEILRIGQCLVKKIWTTKVSVCVFLTHSV